MAVASHISRKTSEMWGTHRFVANSSSRQSTLLAPEAIYQAGSETQILYLCRAPEGR